MDYLNSREIKLLVNGKLLFAQTERYLLADFLPFSHKEQASPNTVKQAAWKRGITLCGIISAVPSGVNGNPVLWLGDNRERVRPRVYQKRQT